MRMTKTRTMTSHVFTAKKQASRRRQSPKAAIVVTREAEMRMRRPEEIVGSDSGLGAHGSCDSS